MCGRIRKAIGFVIVVGALTAASVASGQPFPSKPVRFIVPLTAGGVVDLLARAVAGELSRVWGHQVVVENRPGANTIIGAEFVVKSPADGYTMLFTNPSTLAINQFLFKKLPYNAERDLTPVFNVAYAPTIIVVNPQVAANTLQDLVGLARSNPGTIAYGSFGIGSATHVSTELFSARAGIRLNHIPFKGDAEVVPALVAGHIQLAFVGITAAYQLARQGRVKPLALSAPGRTKLMPDVPTLAEAGYPDLVLGGWFGIVAPGATPRPVIDKIAGDLGAIFGRAEFRDRVTTDVGLDPLLQPPAEFARFLRSEREKYAQIIQRINVSLD